MIFFQYSNLCQLLFHLCFFPIPVALNRYKILEIIFIILDLNFGQIWRGDKNEKTFHLFDDIHSNENKKYSFHIELVSKGTRLK